MNSFKGFMEHPLMFDLTSEMNKALVKQVEFSFNVPCYALIHADDQYTLLNMRKTANMSQQTAARLLKTTQPSLSRYEDLGRLPPKDVLNNMLDIYRVDRKAFAEYMKQKILNGSLVVPPIYALADNNFVWETQSQKDLVWQLTVTQWRNQCGIPLDFKAARCALGIKKLAYAKTTEFNHRMQQKLEKVRIKELGAHELIYVAIAYRISPLSLINGVLLSTLDWNNKVLGGKVRVLTGQSRWGRPEYAVLANEGFFSELKDLIISLGLIPKWQVPLFDTYMLTTLANYTREATGCTQYLPFPLSPKNYRAWNNDPILSLYQPEIPPTNDFWYNLGEKTPLDDLRVKDDLQFYNFLINPVEKPWVERMMSDEG